MNKKSYDNAKAAAAKFITIPDEGKKESEPAAEPVKRKPGRPKKTAATADQKPQKTAETATATKARKSPTKKPEAATEAITKPQKKSDGKAAFSVWMTKATAEEVKQYSAITGEKMTDICEAALSEYLKNHAPTKKQKEEYRKRELERINNI